MERALLQPSYDMEGACIQAGEKTFHSVTQLAEGLPDFVAKARGGDRGATVQLANAIAYLQDSRYTLAQSEEHAAGEIAKWAEPPLYDVPRWLKTMGLSRPPLAELGGPAWQDGKLVFNVWSTDWSAYEKFVFGQRMSVDPETWSVSSVHLEGERCELNETLARVDAAFGAVPEGFFALSLSDYSRVLIAVGADLPKRCALLRNKEAEPEGFADYAALAEAAPLVLEPKAVADLADGLGTFYRERAEGFGNLQLIRDGAAYQAEYHEKGYKTFKLRYWVDQLRVTDCHVPDLETVADPSLEGNALVAYFKGDKYQPVRVEGDLTQLTLSSPPKATAMATETFVSDTRDGPSGPERPRFDEPPSFGRASEGGLP